MAPGPTTNRFKAALAAGEPAVALWITTPSAALVEIAAAQGLDAAFVDMEHASLSLEAVETLCTVARLAGVTPVVRAPSPGSDVIGRLLDGGAEGVIFPQVSDRDAAERARRSLRYPPEGTRGWGPNMRQALWSGPTTRSTEYADRAAADIASIFLVEDPQGVDDVEGILDTGRPDGVAFGWSDYTAAVGFDMAASAAAADRVHAAARARGIGVALYPGPHHGLPPGTGDASWYPGCFMVAGMDSALLTGAVKNAIAAAQQALSAGAER